MKSPRRLGQATEINWNDLCQERGFVCSAQGYISDTWISAAQWELIGTFGMNQGAN